MSAPSQRGWLIGSLGSSKSSGLGQSLALSLSDSLAAVLKLKVKPSSLLSLETIDVDELIEDEPEQLLKDKLSLDKSMIRS